MKKQKFSRQKPINQYRRFRNSADEIRTFHRNSQNRQFNVELNQQKEKRQRQRQKESLNAMMIDYQRLNQRIKQLESENSILFEQKQFFKGQFANFLREIKKYQQLGGIERENNHFFKNIQDIFTLKKDLQQKEKDYVQMIRGLESQNCILQSIKDKYKDKFMNEKNKYQVLFNMINVYKDQIKKCEERLQKEIEYNKKSEVQVAKLQSQLQEALRDLQQLLQNQKRREEQVLQNQTQYLKDVQKLKEKYEKYKQKAQQYKTQRDQIAYEMERAKFEIGTQRIKKYLPSERDY